MNIEIKSIKTRYGYYACVDEKTYTENNWSNHNNMINITRAAIASQEYTTDRVIGTIKDFRDAGIIEDCTRSALVFECSCEEAVKVYGGVCA